MSHPTDHLADHLAGTMLRMLMVLVLSLGIPSSSVAGTSQLARAALAAHSGQIRGKARAAVQTHKVYSNLVKMLRDRKNQRRQAAGTLLVELVQQASTPGQLAKVQLYPRLDTRNHDRFNAACEKNLQRLLQIATRLARGTAHERQVASRMAQATRTLEFGALVALTQTWWRLGERDKARQAAAQAILNFPPADQLVRSPHARRTRIGRNEAATIHKALWVIRTGRTPWHGLRDLRREDSAYDGRSVVPRLQAIGYLASRSRGWPAARLCRELVRWEPVANFRLAAHKNDQWVPARGIARISAMGLGHLREAPVRLARGR